MEYYTVQDVMTICGVSQSKAYNIIRALNDELIKEGTPKGSIIPGKISKKYFHEKMKV